MILFRHKLNHSRTPSRVDFKPETVRRLNCFENFLSLLFPEVVNYELCCRLHSRDQIRDLFRHLSEQNNRLIHVISDINDREDSRNDCHPIQRHRNRQQRKTRHRSLRAQPVLPKPGYFLSWSFSEIKRRVIMINFNLYFHQLTA